MAVLATMISIILFYLLVIVWSRRADIRDRDSQEGVLVVGKSWNHYAYEVTISTRKGRNSGTTANVAFIMVGENGSSGVLPLSKLTKAKFNRGSVITCTIHLPSSLGQLLYLHIWHDNSGDNPSWSLDHVVIRDTLSDERWNFMCGEWLAVESDDGKTDKVIYVANISEMSNYKYLFLSNSADGLYDEHLWISVAAKPPQSNFSRVQRASCCLSILFSTMIANAMFYDNGKVDTSPVFFLGPLKISMRQLMIGIQSSLIIFPINLAMAQLFRKSSTAATTAPASEEKPKTPKTEPKTATFSQRFGRRPSSAKYLPMPYQVSITSSMSTIISDSGERLTTRESTFNIKKDHDTEVTSDNRKKLFYRCLYYLAWIFCFVSVFVSAFFTLLYSLQWGKERSEQWLLSFFVSFIQDAAVSQPVKVAIFSAFIAFVLKFSMEQREKLRQGKTQKTRTDNDAERTQLTEVQIDDDDVAGDDSQPLQKNALEKAKIKRMKEMKSSEVITDVLFYSLFLLLLLMVAYGHRDPIAYEMTKHLENTLSLSPVSTYFLIHAVIKDPQLHQEHITPDPPSPLLGLRHGAVTL
ncbi:hypothetical protein OS493_039070 [Desmophyllum pertusum]|uniref:PLAT domain-containing protein n=1 Tax=Desmophyllum pertusum TaxID=174260 RepID=A0A9X0CZL7_9CNID|nr:hypothetical protein OS493_039070 [Desmophyllum pertusum]